jgi:HK97 family phage portal protein
MSKGRKSFFSGATTGSGLLVVRGAPTALQVGDTYRTYNELYGTSPAVRCIVDFLGRQVSRYAIETDDSAVDALLANPGNGLSEVELKRHLASSTALSGNGFAAVLRNQKEVVPLAPDRVSRLDSGDYEVVTGGFERRRIAAADMVHVRLFNPADPMFGSSPLDSLRDVLAEDKASAKDRTRFWRNSSRPSTIILRGLEAPEWGETERERFRKQWTELNTEDSTYSAVVLEDSMEPANVPSVSPRDAQWVEGRQLSLAVVASVYGVPPTALGASTENLRAAGRLIASAVAPWASLVEASLSQTFATPIRLTRKHEISDVSQDLERLVKQGILNPEEAKALIDLD